SRCTGRASCDHRSSIRGDKKMKAAILCWNSLLSLLLLVSPAQSQGGFREVLKIVDIEPTWLAAVNIDQPTTENWQVVSQVVARLDQHAADLDRWTLQGVPFTEDNVG